MTPRQIYEMPAERVDNDPSHLFGYYYYNHLPEAGDKEDIRSWIHDIKQERISIRFIKDFCFDGRRVWRLAVVVFDGRPVMITQNAGREGDDHAVRFITDIDGMMRMAEFIISLKPPERIDEVERVGLDEDIPHLAEFYGQRLDDPFHHHTTY